MLSGQLEANAGLSDAAVTYVELAAARPATFRVMFHAALKPFTRFPALEVAAGKALQELHRVVGHEVARGAMKDDAAHSAVSTAWATMHGLATLLIEGQLAGPFPGRFEDVGKAARRAVAHLLR